MGNTEVIAAVCGPKEDENKGQQLSDKALGPLLSARKKLVVQKLAEEEVERNVKGVTKKEKHLIGEKGHVKPANYLDSNKKLLIGIATRGGSWLLLGLYGDDGKTEPFTNCSVSCLKTIDLHNFKGNDSEISLLKTLLTGALCLERINLFSFNSPSGKFKEWGDLQNWLEEFPRRAKHCVVTIF